MCGKICLDLLLNRCDRVKTKELCVTEEGPEKYILLRKVQEKWLKILWQRSPQSAITAAATATPPGPLPAGPTTTAPTPSPPAAPSPSGGLPSSPPPESTVSGRATNTPPTKSSSPGSGSNPAPKEGLEAGNPMEAQAAQLNLLLYQLYRPYFNGKTSKKSKAFKFVCLDTLVMLHILWPEISQFFPPCWQFKAKI